MGRLLARLNQLKTDLSHDPSGGREAGLCDRMEIREAMVHAGIPQVRAHDPNAERRGFTQDEFRAWVASERPEKADSEQVELSKILEKVRKAINTSQEQMAKAKKASARSGKKAKRVQFHDDVDVEKHLEDQPKIQQRAISREQ